jgi:hypothetical protein
MHQSSPTCTCSFQIFSWGFTRGRTPVKKGREDKDGKRGKVRKGREGKGMAGERREEEGKGEGSRGGRKGRIAYPVFIC